MLNIGLSTFSLNTEQLFDIGKNFGCFIVGSNELSPADSVLYKVRDVTATVNSAELTIGNLYYKNNICSIHT